MLFPSLPPKDVLPQNGKAILWHRKDLLSGIFYSERDTAYGKGHIQFRFQFRTYAVGEDFDVADRKRTAVRQLQRKCVDAGSASCTIGIDGELLAGSLPYRQLKIVVGWLALHEDECYGSARRPDHS